MTKDIFNWLDYKDVLAEYRLYEDFKNIVDGIFVRKNIKYNKNIIEEVKQDIILSCFNNVLRKIKDEYRNCPSAVYGFIQKGIKFSLLKLVNKYTTKENKKENKTSLFNRKNMLEYTSTNIEEEILNKDFIRRMHKMAMSRTRAKINDNKERCIIILDYIEKNGLYDILLDFREFTKIFDLKSFTRHKICGTYQLEMKQVLIEHYKGENMPFKFDDTDYDFEEDMDDAIFDEEDDEENEDVVLIKENTITIPSEEVKIIETKAKKTKSVKLTPTIQEFIGNAKADTIIDTENFSPDIDGEKASNIMREMGTNWIYSSHKLGKIIHRAKQHYGKSRTEFVDWLQVHCKIAYSTAMSLIKVGKLSDQTLKLMVDNNLTSTHVTKLQSLPYEEQQISFLKQSKHKIDEEGTEVDTKKMTPSDIQAAVRLINKKPEAKKTNEELFWDTCKKFNNFLTNNSDEFITQVIDNRKVDIGIYTPDQIAAIQNLGSTLKWFKQDFDEVIFRLFPDQEDD